MIPARPGPRRPRSCLEMMSIGAAGSEEGSTPSPTLGSPRCVCMKVDASGSKIVYSTTSRLGRTSPAIAVDNAGRRISRPNRLLDFPIASALQSAPQGRQRIPVGARLDRAHWCGHLFWRQRRRLATAIALDPAGNIHLQGGPIRRIFRSASVSTALRGLRCFPPS